MLAPIALYPDALLSQILMASTYPLEIVEAARWRKDNAALKGQALEDALKKQPWDESVKSLCAFPDVLDRMNKDLAWTQKLGDAFLAQQAQVLDTVQSLRKKAQAAGNLKSNEQQKVDVQTRTTSIIVIEPANPQVVYVPTYQPTVVYGGWPYPAYPPYYPPYWVRRAPPSSAASSGASASPPARRCGAAATGATTSTSTSTGTTTSTAPISATATGITTPHIAARCPTVTTGRATSTATTTARRRSRATSSAAARAARVAAASMIVRHCRTRPLTAEAGGAAGNRDLGTHVGGSATRNFDGAGGGRGGGLNTGNGSQAHDYSNRGNASMGNRSFSSGGGAARGGGGMARGGGRGRR